ncbi:MAG: ATP synthase F0 subunit B [Deltaproteobacteria bacterium]|nr:ATP synthase F0 subunit B [Deltaproteobacteria bacterium]MBV8451033.1 ATP synthase F0 subunit B [Deltaproteobacteria bacterium]
MKARIVRISLSVAAVFWPSWVFAAEGEQAEGSWFALIFYTINFLLFLWIVGKYGWPRITQFFLSHSHTIREIRGRAEKAYREAQEQANRAAQQLQQLEADKRKVMSELDQETAYQIGQMNDAAREAVSRIRRDTEITTMALRDGAQRRLRQTMAEAAGRIAHELVSRNFQASDQAQLLQGFIDRISEEARR